MIREYFTRLITTALCVAGFISASQVLFSCSDETTSTYSKKHPVKCDFMVVQYTELFNVVGNFGQFATIRKSGAKITMKGPASENTYNLLETQKYFNFGLGGIIVGTNYNGDMRAYDLSCPNCDRVDKRLVITSDSYAKCSHCEIEYNLNYDGTIFKVPEKCIHQSPRGLFRYRVVYDGTYIHIYN